jgi:hypothetical protein
MQGTLRESLKITRRNQDMQSWRDKNPIFLLQNLLTSSQRSHSSCPEVASRCPFKSSSNTLMPASVTPTPSVNLNTVTAHSLGSGSGHSAPSTPLCFRTSTRWSGVGS